MTLIEEFRKFISRGNVLDLAVGVLIGAAFGKIVASLTESVLMPLIGWLFGDVDFSNYFVRLGSVPKDYVGSLQNYAELKQAGVPMIGYGDFLTQLVNFLVVAAALFLLVKTINRVTEAIEEDRKGAEAPSDSDKPSVDPQIELLREIRDALKK
jgi:large conductance mechanosensitive channel